jgi:hypothetical protein
MPHQAQTYTRLSPGPDRRSARRRAGQQVRVDDFSEDEWLAIEDEAPGTRAELERLLRAAQD